MEAASVGASTGAVAPGAAAAASAHFQSFARAPAQVPVTGNGQAQELKPGPAGMAGLDSYGAPEPAEGAPELLSGGAGERFLESGGGSESGSGSGGGGSSSGAQHRAWWDLKRRATASTARNPGTGPMAAVEGGSATPRGTWGGPLEGVPAFDGGGSEHAAGAAQAGLAGAAAAYSGGNTRLAATGGGRFAARLAMRLRRAKGPRSSTELETAVLGAPGTPGTGSRASQGGPHGLGAHQRMSSGGPSPLVVGDGLDAEDASQGQEGTKGGGSGGGALEWLVTPRAPRPRGLSSDISRTYSASFKGKRLAWWSSAHPPPSQPSTQSPLSSGSAAPSATAGGGGAAAVADGGAAERVDGDGTGGLDGPPLKLALPQHGEGHDKPAGPKTVAGGHAGMVQQLGAAELPAAPVLMRSSSCMPAVGAGSFPSFDGPLGFDVHMEGEGAEEGGEEDEGGVEVPQRGKGSVWGDGLPPAGALPNRGGLGGKQPGSGRGHEAVESRREGAAAEPAAGSGYNGARYSTSERRGAGEGFSASGAWADGGRGPRRGPQGNGGGVQNGGGRGEGGGQEPSPHDGEAGSYRLWPTGCSAGALRRAVHALQKDMEGLEHVNRGTHRSGYDDVYDGIRRDCPIVHSRKVATMGPNRVKNRYSDVLPYDKNRVVLGAAQGRGSCDYINASYIQAPKAGSGSLGGERRGAIPGSAGGRETSQISAGSGSGSGSGAEAGQGLNLPLYIATQGPLESTVEDFWEMVVQEQCAAILMLTREVEGSKLKCGHYFPSRPGASETYGRMKVTVLLSKLLHQGEPGTPEAPGPEGARAGGFHADGEKDVSTVQRTLRVQDIENPGRELVVEHFHYLDWPDHGVPTSTVHIRHLIRSLREGPLSAGPFVVHCSAGIGRTGTYCTIDWVVRKVLARACRESASSPRSGEGMPSPALDIPATLRAMRAQRAGMVQTRDQFKFCYLAVLEELEDIAVSLERR